LQQGKDQRSGEDTLYCTGPAGDPAVKKLGRGTVEGFPSWKKMSLPIMDL